MGEVTGVRSEDAVMEVKFSRRYIQKSYCAEEV